VPLISLIVPPRAAEDMLRILDTPYSLGISLNVHAPQRFDRISVHAAFMEAKAANADIIVSMLPLPASHEVFDNVVFPAADLDKLTQFEQFTANSIPTLKTLPFEFGMTFPGSPLDIVTLKPSALDTSLPNSMITLRKGALRGLLANTLDRDHLIHKTPYIAQEYMETSPKPTSFRVVLFLGAPILAYRIESRFHPPHLGVNEAYMGMKFISNNSRLNGYDVELVSDSEMVRVAVDMSACVGHPPLTKCDLLYNYNMGWKALEVSSTDFNGWPLGRKNLVNSLGREKMIRQFNMFDVMAKQINKVVEKLL
jgi:hypothetical protein